MAVLELLGNFGIQFGMQPFIKNIEPIFMTYLTNTAAAVRMMGIKKSEELAKLFKRDWVVENYIPEVRKAYKADKKGYNFRICCLYSLEAIISNLSPEDFS